MVVFLNRVRAIGWRGWMFVLVLCGCQWGAQAGVMTHERLSEIFPSPLIVGEKEHELPVWPILKQEMTSTPVIGYVFESIDMAPIPGFSGTPFNLLVALDAQGRFMDVRVLSQHEPVFLEGLGEKPLLQFVSQYQNLSLKQGIKITGDKKGYQSNDAVVYIDGVAKATASVRILNQSLLASSLKVARAKLGYGEGRDPDQIGKIRQDVKEVTDWNGLLKRDLIQHQLFLNQDIEKAFASTSVAGDDPEMINSPKQTFVDIYAAYLNVPTVGKSLLQADQWAYLQQRLEPGDVAILVLWDGHYSLLSEDFVRGTVSDRLTIEQLGLPVEMRDMDLDIPLNLPEALQSYQWRVFRVIAPAGLDPALPLAFQLHVTRSKGIVYPELVRQDFSWRFEMPSDYVISPEEDQKTWKTIWRDRLWELAALAVGFLTLLWALSQPAWLMKHPQRLKVFRISYLIFTLGFIGWFAQGQLSIVNFTGVIQAVLAGRGLGFLLYDPMTVSLWVFVLLTLVVWGRGTFCGWLCPFGALQELVALLTRRLGLRWQLVPWQRDQQLKKIKYGLWLGLMVSACLSVGWTDRLVEVEPFKTSITLVFVREWPFVIWAVAAVLISTVYFKAYCRYVCPLGAGLGVLAWLRRRDWITRRQECGQPCQRCRHDCAYQAIDRDGTIQYQECFQCFDCVVIYESDSLCVPRILDQRKAVIPIVAHQENQP